MRVKINDNLVIIRFNSEEEKKNFSSELLTKCNILLRKVKDKDNKYIIRLYNNQEKEKLIQCLLRLNVSSMYIDGKRVILKREEK